MNLSPAQQQALSEFNVFLDSDKPVFILRGSAGTGKTTLLREFVNTIQHRHRTCCLMAPTGRAALILNERTKYPAATIHRTIYGLDDPPQKINDKWRFFLKENQDPTNTVYFVDEASMIADVYQDNEMFLFGSGRLLADLINYCGLNQNRKLVFIGDYAQLPPVMQSLSPALDEQYLKKNYDLASVQVTLTEVVRQTADSGIYQNARQIRMAIDTGQYTKFQLLDGADIETLSTDSFIEKYDNTIKHSGIENTIVITYSNAQALNYNKRIRAHLYGTAQTTVVSGDFLLITRNNYSLESLLFNGMIVQVEKVSPEVEIHRPLVGKKQIELKFRRISFSVDGIKTQAYLLDDFLNDKSGSLSIEQQKALWADFEQRMRQRGITPKEAELEFYTQLKKDPYYNALQCKYGYAITCHKAQGGEWENVFVDMDTYTGKANETFFRWAYTAITRAKKRLWHLSSPSFSPIDRFVLQPVMTCKSTRLKYHIPEHENFLDLRFKNISQISEQSAITCVENRSAAYQHRITFNKDNQQCTLSLWYNKNFYTGKIDIIRKTDDALVPIALEICKEALYAVEFSYIPRFSFQQELHNHIMDTADEAGVRVTNVIQNPWSDLYFIETEADEASVEFYFNGKHYYTYAQPRSTLGEKDETLNRFLNLL